MSFAQLMHFFTGSFSCLTHSGGDERSRDYTIVGAKYVNRYNEMARAALMVTGPAGADHGRLL